MAVYAHNTPQPCSAGLTNDALLCRKGATALSQSLVIASLVGVSVLLLWIVGGPVSWASHRIEVLFALGGIALWRWSWFAIQNTRAIIYRYWSFPRLRRAAESAVARFGPVPEV